MTQAPKHLWSIVNLHLNILPFVLSAAMLGYADGSPETIAK